MTVVAIVVAVVAMAVAGIASAAPAAAAPPSFYGTPFERKPDVATLTRLGRALFADASLSASGRLSCASCHDPAHAYAPANGLAVQLGGRDGRQPGLRAVPSLTYRQNVPPFSEHYSDTDGDDSVDQGPTGGRDWDGRASSAHEQAIAPLLSPFEMANADRDAVVAKLRASANATRFRDAFGAHVLDDPQLAWNGLLWALEVFQQSPAEFYPYSSKYDAFLRGQVELEARERRGLALFNDPAKGNCAACHPSAIKHGAFPSFTDHGFIAIGVPRNPAIPANADPRHHDLGLCGPLRTDLAGRDEYCGLFKTPSLRNVATRRVFFHNGVFHRLDDAVRFYAQRDVQPEAYYRRDRSSGRAVKFDDLPAHYRGNVNTDAPFDRHVGQRPALSEAEIGDIVAFLKTLSDGYVVPPTPLKAARTAATAGSS
ncbi:MAG TPA: cytochrome c peroxidase [Burkholderiaceae bacterium]|nr:cytochrome c peroxidase [Burkholderiaceae bacterium]